MLYPDLEKTIHSFDFNLISEERRSLLLPLLNFLKNKIDQSSKVNLNFICTHNSRRSQFAQIWAQTAAAYYGRDVACYSGGIEITAFNERAVNAIKNDGFKIKKEGGINPVYTVQYADNARPIIAFSKLFDNPINPDTGFAAVMTCSHADENCPLIPGIETKISLHYEDPKKFDGTPEEVAKYKERSVQIATEMFYVFSKIKSSHDKYS